MSCKWNHTVLNHLFLAPFTSCHAFEIHPWLFPQLLFSAKKHVFVPIYHHSFTPLSTDKHRSVYDKDAPKLPLTCVHRCAREHVLSLLAKYLGVGFQDHTVSAYLASEDTADCFPTWLPFCILTDTRETPSCSAPSPALCIVCFFRVGHSSRCMVVTHCGFNLHCRNYQWCWTSFHVLICHLLSAFVSPSL